MSPTKLSRCFSCGTATQRFADFLQTIGRSEASRLEWIDPARFHSASAWFRQHSDKDWAFTDCVSFVVMRELRIRDAFTTDPRFRQAGFTPLLKA